MHPLMGSLQDYTESQLEEKIVDLQKKYFQSNNPSVQNQIVLALDTFKEELDNRRKEAAKKQMQQMQENGDSGLDSLINVS